MTQGKVSTKYIVKSVTNYNTCFEGYASVFDVVDHHNDIIAKGAFESSLLKNIKLLWQHDATKPIGVVYGLREDNFGLKIEAEINNNIATGCEASELIKQKAIEGLSIGFSIKAAEYNNEGYRIITDLDLLEVSIVTFPANQDAQIMQVKCKETKDYSKALLSLEKLSQNLIKSIY